MLWGYDDLYFVFVLKIFICSYKLLHHRDGQSRLLYVSCELGSCQQIQKFESFKGFFICISIKAMLREILTGDHRKRPRYQSLNLWNTLCQTLSRKGIITLICWEYTALGNSGTTLKTFQLHTCHIKLVYNAATFVWTYFLIKRLALAIVYKPMIMHRRCSDNLGRNRVNKNHRQYQSPSNPSKCVCLATIALDMRIQTALWVT